MAHLSQVVIKINSILDFELSMSSIFIHKRWFPIILISIVIFVGGLLRLNELGNRTIGHIEIYIPGIELPLEYSEPPPRLTLLKSITEPIADEVHPPGYYMFMFIMAASSLA